MPRHCCVVGCKSNYSNKEKYVSTFSIPKNETLREKWKSRVPADIKNPVFCVKHFRKEDIIRVDHCIVSGVHKEYKRKYPKLKDGAVPIIFEDGIFEEFNIDSIGLQEEHLFTIEDIMNFYQNNMKSSNWTLLKEIDKLHFCIINSKEGAPFILCSIIVNFNMDYSIYINNEKLSVQELPKKLKVLNSVNVLEEMLSFVFEYANGIITVEENKLCKAINLLQDVSEERTDNSQLLFLIEQLELYQQTPNTRRYIGATMILASTLFVQSSASYLAIYNSKLLYLPHPRNLQKLIGKFSVTSGSNIKDSTEYLKTRISLLKKYELIINIHLDEIYVNPELNFKGNNIVGCSESNPTQVAKTIQVFMISSIFSKYRDVVSLIPVKNLTALQLKGLMVDVLIKLENIGFTVISFISDNNAVNRKAFELFFPNNSLQVSITHPLDPQRLLFFIFDVVHILKCIRNNWISKRTHKCQFLFPDIDIMTKTLFIADFQHLESLYDFEKKSLVKLAHQLSYKVLYPSTIQKQNVKLALGIFNEKNIAALKCISKENMNLLSDVKGTALFLDIIVKWWKIVNVKSAWEGKRFNDEYRDPIRSSSTLQLEYLKNILLWLQRWRITVPISQSLSAQTFQSFAHTTDTFLHLIPYIFEKYKTDYLLLSKFQNDILEGRFGHYRQLSGANYYISLMQVLESEKKIRFKNFVLLSCGNKDISLKTLLPCDENSSDNFIKIDDFSEIYECDFSLNEIPTERLSVLVYISGYAVRKILRNGQCPICISWLQYDEEIDVEMPTDLTIELDRGKLLLPSEIALVTVSVVWFTLQKICDSCNLYNLFLSGMNHLPKLNKISNILLEKHMQDRPDLVNNEACNCNETLDEKLRRINFIACRIMLNNYVKKENDSHSQSKISLENQRKIKKLKT